MAMTKCKECGKDISDTAEACPHCGDKPKRTSGCAMIAAVFIGIAVVGSVAARCSTGDPQPAGSSSPATSAATKPHDDLSLFVQRFGQPDEDTSTQYDNPRPPMVTRFLVYSKERVRAAYVPDAPVGSPPPYAQWKLIGFQDPKTNAVVQPAEAVERLKGRDRGRQ